MTDMTITLPESLGSFLDRQVSAGGFESRSAFLRELVERERDRERLRELVLEGADSPLVPGDVDIFGELRRIARGQDPVRS